MRWILTCLTIAALFIGISDPHLLVSWKDSVKQFLARAAGDWPLYLFGLNGILVSGLVFLELVNAICSSGTATPPNTMEPLVEMDSTAMEKR